MPWLDWYTLLGMGGAFFILGVLGILWGKYEERTYYDTIANRPDVREFLEHLPWRPEPHAIIIGGRICLAIAIFCFIMALVFWLWL